MIGVTEPPFTCPRCGHVEMSLTAISRHDLDCVPAVEQSGVSRDRPGFSGFWFKLRVKLYMRLFMLDHERRRRRKGH